MFSKGEHAVAVAAAALVTVAVAVAALALALAGKEPNLHVGSALPEHEGCLDRKVKRDKLKGALLKSFLVHAVLVDGPFFPLPTHNQNRAQRPCCDLAT